VVDFKSVLGYVTPLENTMHDIAMGEIRSMQEQDQHRAGGAHNIMAYLSKLTDNPGLLLSAMRDCHVFISGSRAPDFIYGGVCGNASDWDFYGQSCDVTAARFMCELTKMGVVWSGCVDGTEREIPYEGSFVVMEGNLVSSVSGPEGSKIQFMWTRTTSKSAFQTVVEFHSSVVQCMITGWCAISMYHLVTSKRKIMAWDIDPVVNPIKREKAPGRVAKYVSRGFGIVEYSPGVTNTVVLQLPGMVRHPRSISDTGCLVVDFKSVLGYVTPLENTMHDIAMGEIRSMNWSEGQGPNCRLSWARAQGESAECGLYRSMKMTENTYMLKVLEPTTPVKLTLVCGENRYLMPPAFTELVLDRDDNEPTTLLRQRLSITSRFMHHSVIADTKTIPIM
jgi:hypothetical protein